MSDDGFSYWFPKGLLNPRGFPAWAVLFPPLWPVLLFFFAAWMLGVVAVLLVSVPVNIVRALAYQRRVPSA